MWDLPFEHEAAAGIVGGGFQTVGFFTVFCQCPREKLPVTGSLDFGHVDSSDKLSEMCPGAASLLQWLQCLHDKAYLLPAAQHAVESTFGTDEAFVWICNIVTQCDTYNFIQYNNYEICIQKYWTLPIEKKARIQVFYFSQFSFPLSCSCHLRIVVEAVYFPFVPSVHTAWTLWKLAGRWALGRWRWGLQPWKSKRM